MGGWSDIALGIFIVFLFIIFRPKDDEYYYRKYKARKAREKFRRYRWDDDE